MFCNSGNVDKVICIAPRKEYISDATKIEAIMSLIDGGGTLDKCLIDYTIRDDVKFNIRDLLEKTRKFYIN